MIIIHELSLVIIHNPKCAGKALRDAFLPLDADISTFWHWSFSVQLGRHIDMAHLPLNLLRDYPEWELFERYTVIAVIRNPVDRFFSALKEHESQHNRKLSDEEYLLDLDEIRVEYDPRYIHLCPQHRFTHIGNKRKVDFIARHEHLVDDMRAIGIIAGLGAKYFDAINCIPSYAATSGMVSDERKEMFMPLIKRLYFRDFLLFGYKLGVVETEKINSKNSEALFSKLNCYAYDYIDWINNGDHKPAYERFLSVQGTKDKIDSIIAERDSVIAERDSVIAERDSLVAERDQILNSLSWKITKPLRFIRHNLSKLYVKGNQKSVVRCLTMVPLKPNSFWQMCAKATDKKVEMAMHKDDWIIEQFERLYIPETGGWHVPGGFSLLEPFDPSHVEKYLALPPRTAPIEKGVGDFFAAVVGLLQPQNVLETGTNMGYSCAKVARALYKLRGNDARIYTIDVGEFGPIVRQMECRSIITEIKGNSLTCGIPDVKFDMLILDSDHTYGTIAGEIERFDPYLAEGGSILFHDSIYFDGVGLAVRQLAETCCYELVTLKSPRKGDGGAARCPGVTIARKKRDLAGLFHVDPRLIAVDINFKPERQCDPAWIVDSKEVILA